VVKGETGVYFDSLAPNVAARAVAEMMRTNFDAGTIVDHAPQFRPDAFKARILAVVNEESRLG
jgi:hypothetical protein